MAGDTKTSLSFGPLVSIPISLRKAQTPKETGGLKSHMFHSCGTQVESPYYCPQCQKILSRSVKEGDIYKGYLAKDGVIPWTEQDDEALPLVSLGAVSILAFAPMKDVFPEGDPRWVEDTYLIYPDYDKKKMKAAEMSMRAFVLFATTMADMELVGVSKIALKANSRETPCVVRPWKHSNGSPGLILHRLYFGDQIREYKMDSGLTGVSLTDKERTLGKTLVSGLIKPVDLSSFKDEYGEAIAKVLEMKMTGKKFDAPVAAKAPEVLDLAEALLASINASKEAAKV